MERLANMGEPEPSGVCPEDVNFALLAKSPELDDVRIGDVFGSASRWRPQSPLCANSPTVRIRVWRWAGNPIYQLGQRGVGQSHGNPRACLHRVVVLLGGVRANTCLVAPKLLLSGNAGDRGVSKTKLLTLVSQWDSGTTAWHGNSLRSTRASPALSTMLQY